MSLVFQLAPSPSVPVLGQAERFPVRRIYCVGRNYEEHAKEMGFTGREPPFFFLKPADALVVVNEGETGQMAYPSLTQNLHHEIELVVAIGTGGRNIKAGFDQCCGVNQQTGADHFLQVAILESAEGFGDADQAFGQLGITAGFAKQDGNLAFSPWEIKAH